MASAISKRQQARNERSLQDLIRSVPGNDRCADCAAKNPGWASWNLGIFLCMRCAALHRKLGTHISKVKSLSMDSWSTEQVDNMKKVGNVASNKLYNPQNVRAEVPIDVDEVDSAMERYIRQKYDQRTLSSGRGASRQNAQHTGSTGTGTGTGTGSWSEDGPDLPPKPAKRFGFTLRSSSAAAAAVPKRQERITPPLSPAFSGSERSHELPSPKINKPSRLFGMKITTIDNNFNQKLIYLRDMGFSDNSKNTEVLKGTGGNVEKAVETLVRLGEGSKPMSRSVTPGPRALTPVSMGSSGANGISVEKKKESNPWEIRESAAPPVPARAASVPPQSTSSDSWNPFLQPPARTQEQSPLGLENSLQNLHLSPPQHCAQTNQQAFYQNSASQQANNPFFQQQQQPQRSAQQGTTYPPAGQQWQQSVHPQPSQPSNPWMQQSTQQSLMPNNPWTQQAQQQQSQAKNYAGNPWEQQNLSQQQPIASPQPLHGQQSDFFAQPQQAQQPAQQQFMPASASIGWGPQQPQQNAVQNPWQQQSLQQQLPQQQQQAQDVSQNPWAPAVQQPQQNAASNPWQQQQQSQQHQAQARQFGTQTPLEQQMQQQQQFQQPQQSRLQPHQQQPGYVNFGQQYGQPQPVVRHDKSSILSLYNHPQMAPQRPLQTLPEDATLQQQSQLEHVPQRSATMPVSMMTGGNLNPFGAQQQPQPGHVNRDSVDFQGFAGNGRHSPDAFSSLSARYMR